MTLGPIFPAPINISGKSNLSDGDDDDNDVDDGGDDDDDDDDDTCRKKRKLRLVAAVLATCVMKMSVVLLFTSILI